MKINLLVTSTFEKEFKRLAKKYNSLVSDLFVLQEELLNGKDIGTDLGSGFRKIRLQLSSKHNGKSGGARVITLTVMISLDEMNVNLLYIYDKSERSSISVQELKRLKEKNGLLATPQGVVETTNISSKLLAD